MNRNVAFPFSYVPKVRMKTGMQNCGSYEQIHSYENENRGDYLRVDFPGFKLSIEVGFGSN